MWDIEVDVAVIGAGIGGLANAIATVDAGGEVLVADAAPHAAVSSPRGCSGSASERAPCRCCPRRPTARPTSTSRPCPREFCWSAEPAGDAPVPRRDARNLSREEAFGSVEPFFGSRLNAWAEQCITSPYGLMYTSMRDWRTTTMRSGERRVRRGLLGRGHGLVRTASARAPCASGWPRRPRNATSRCSRPARSSGSCSRRASSSASCCRPRTARARCGPAPGSRWRRRCRTRYHDAAAPAWPRRRPPAGLPRRPHREPLRTGRTARHRARCPVAPHVHGFASAAARRPARRRGSRP